MSVIKIVTKNKDFHVTEGGSAYMSQGKLTEYVGISNPEFGRQLSKWVAGKSGAVIKGIQKYMDDPSINPFEVVDGGKLIPESVIYATTMYYAMEKQNVTAQSAVATYVKGGIRAFIYTQTNYVAGQQPSEVKSLVSPAKGTYALNSPDAVNSEYVSIKEVYHLTGTLYGWRKLLKGSTELNLHPIKVLSDAYPKGVNAYHKDVWNLVFPSVLEYYDVEL